MAFHFCPQCGAKLQPGFKFCPSCGERLPCPHDRLLPVTMAASLGSSAPEKDGPSKTSPALSPHHQPTQEQSTFTAFVVQYYSNCVCDCNAGELSHRPTGQTCTASSQVTSQSPRRQTRHSPRLAKVTFETFPPPRVSSPATGDQVEGNPVRKQLCFVFIIEFSFWLWSKTTLP